MSPGHWQSKASQVISSRGEKLDMHAAHRNLDRFSSCRKRALQGAILVCGHAKNAERKDVNAKMRQHDVSFQHLRKAQFVVLYISEPVGARAVTNLKEPGRSIKHGRNTYVRSVQNRGQSVIKRRKITSHSGIV